MPCGCSSGATSDGGPLLSTSLDSRFGTPAPAGTVGELESLFSGPGYWIGVVIFIIAAGAVLWASAGKSESV